MPFEVRREANALAVTFVFFIVLFGAILAFTPTSLNSTVTREVPRLPLLIFGLLLLVASLVTLWGIFGSVFEFLGADTVNAMRLEFSGCITLALLCGALGAIFWGNTHLSSATLFSLAFFVGFLIRSVQVFFHFIKMKPGIHKIAEQVSRMDGMEP